MPPRRDQRVVADPNPEEEPPAPTLAERPLAGRHRHRVANPDVGDTGRDDQPGARRQEQGGVGERLAPGGLAHPERPVPERLDLKREIFTDIERDAPKHALFATMDWLQATEADRPYVPRPSEQRLLELAARFEEAATALSGPGADG